MPEYKSEGRCMLCRKIKQVRYIDLYVIGSEGLTICHRCEMLVVESVRLLMTLFNNIRRDEVIDRKVREKKEITE